MRDENGETTSFSHLSATDGFENMTKVSPNEKKLEIAKENFEREISPFLQDLTDIFRREGNLITIKTEKDDKFYPIMHRVIVNDEYNIRISASKDVYFMGIDYIRGIGIEGDLEKEFGIHLRNKSEMNSNDVIASVLYIMGAIAYKKELKWRIVKEMDKTRMRHMNQ